MTLKCTTAHILLRQYHVNLSDLADFYGLRPSSEVGS